MNLLQNPPIYIASGYAVHPAKLLISLPLTEEVAIANGKVPPEIATQLVAIRAHSLADIAVPAFAKIAEYHRQAKERYLNLSTQLKKLPIKPPQAQKYTETMAAISSYAKLFLLKPRMLSKIRDL